MLIILLGQLQVPQDYLSTSNGADVAKTNAFEMSPILTTSTEMKDSIITLDYVSILLIDINTIHAI